MKSALPIWGNEDLPQSASWFMNWDKTLPKWYSQGFCISSEIIAQYNVSLQSTSFINGDNSFSKIVTICNVFWVRNCSLYLIGEGRFLRRGEPRLHGDG